MCTRTPFQLQCLEKALDFSSYLPSFSLLPEKISKARPPTHHLLLGSCGEAEDDSLRINYPSSLPVKM